MKTIIRFGTPRYLPSSVDGIFINFPYTIISDNKESVPKSIRVAISGDLANSWGFQIWQDEPAYDDLKKLFLMYAIKQIEEKYNDGTLLDYEEISFTSSNHPSKRMYDVSNLPEVAGHEEEINI